MAYIREITANVAIVLSVLTQASIAKQIRLDTQNVIDAGNQISWRVIANNTIVDAEEGSWIANEYYSNSIRNVIGTAIADCINGKNEFKDKKAEDVITFSDTTPADYSAENWNAVVLWNFIHEYMCEHVSNRIENSTNPGAKGYYKANQIIDKMYDKIFDKLYDKILSHYRQYSINGLQGKLQTAIEDIKAYSEALKLRYRLPWFFEASNQLKSHNEIGPNNQIAPGLNVWFITYEDKKITRITMGPVQSPFICIKLAGVKYTIPYSIDYITWNKSTIAFYQVDALKQGSDIYYGKEAAAKVPDTLFYKLCHEAASILFKGIKDEIIPDEMIAYASQKGYLWREPIRSYLRHNIECKK